MALGREEQFDILRDDFDEQVALLTTGLANDRLSLDEWERAMRRVIREYHLAVAAVGGGLLAGALAAAARIAQPMIIRQIGFLANWVVELRRRGVENFTEAILTNRARLYGGAGGETFSRAVTQETTLVTLPFFPADQTVCRTGCRCNWSLPRNVGDEIHLDWKLNPADHCDTCLARRALVSPNNPLIIRDGEIVDAERFADPRLYA